MLGSLGSTKQPGQVVKHKVSHQLLVSIDTGSTVSIVVNYLLCKSQGVGCLRPLADAALDDLRPPKADVWALSGRLSSARLACLILGQSYVPLLTATSRRVALDNAFRPSARFGQSDRATQSPVNAGRYLTFCLTGTAEGQEQRHDHERFGL